MRRLLVTGGAGFIGTNFVNYWLTHEPKDFVVVLDALTYAGNPANLELVADSPRFRFVRGDICDTELVTDLLSRECIDCIVHFAAESQVDRSIVGPDDFIRTNVLGTHSLLKSALRVWYGNGTIRREARFHHVSTDEVYGSLATGAPAFTEHNAYSPTSPYSASKAGSDHLVRAYQHTYGLPVTISNCSNNYGPYQFPEKLIPLMLVNALQGKALPVYGRGENVRDWLHVIDHCRAIRYILKSERAGETYNIGGCNQWRNIDVVRLLCTILERKFAAAPDLGLRFPHCPAAQGAKIESLISYVQDRPGHDWRYAIDATKIGRELGFVPTQEFNTGIDQTVDWYLRNEPWWRAVLDGTYRNT